jgi:hypothetical protein
MPRKLRQGTEPLYHVEDLATRPACTLGGQIVVLFLMLLKASAISFPLQVTPCSAFRDESLELCALALLFWPPDQAFLKLRLMLDCSGNIRMQTSSLACCGPSNVVGDDRARHGRDGSLAHKILNSCLNGAIAQCT